MLSDTPIPTFPIKREGAHRCPELSPIQAIPHFKDFAPLVLCQPPINVFSIVSPLLSGGGVQRETVAGGPVGSSPWMDFDILRS